jgi:RNA polymerase sigma-70 factor (ECF subfamily)
MIYCIYSSELERAKYRLLVAYAAEHGLEQLLLERRCSHRRRLGDRRRELWPNGTASFGGPERRRIRNRDGRRVGDRRAPLVPVDPPSPLPRRLRPLVTALGFYERIAPGARELEDLDTLRLITKIQAGERDHFADLYTRYFRGVHNYLVLALRDRHAAEDVAQEVFIQALTELPRFELRRVPVRAWLFQIARNDALNHLRHRKRVEPVDPAVALTHEDTRWNPRAADTEAVVVQWLTDADLLALISRIPDAQRQVLILRYLLDFSMSEIAHVLQSTPQAVRQNHHRALEFLRQRLQALGRTSESLRRGTPMRRMRRPINVLRERRYALM